MDQYHHASGLFHIMHRKRANQIQPSSIDYIKPTTNTIVESSNNSNNSNDDNTAASITTFSSTSSTFTVDLDDDDGDDVLLQQPSPEQLKLKPNLFHVDTFYTVPNLRTLLDRALPTLPQQQSPSLAAPTIFHDRIVKQLPSNNTITRQQRLHHIHTRLQRAVTWLGTPFHKILSTSIELPLMYNVNHGHLQQASNSKQTLNDETGQTIYCKVHQIINHASSKEYEYHLHLQLNNDTIETMPGIMQKAGESTRGYLDCDIPLNVNGPFDLTFVLMAQPLTRFTKVKHRFINKKEIISKKISNHTITNMPVIGVKQIVSGSCPDAFVGQGPFRYTMTQPLSNDQDRFNLELTVSFYSEKKYNQQQKLLQERSLSTCFSSDFLAQEGTAVDMAKTDALGDDDDDDDDGLDQHTLYYCQQGDYLTVYVRGQGFPTWKRYMVKLNEHALLLFDESQKNVGRIPLKPLLFVTFASDEKDQESVLMSSTTGLVLGYERACAKLMEPARLEENEVLEGKVYVYADNIQCATYWKRLLDVYARYPTRKKINAAHQQHSNQYHDDERINLRYMW